MHLRSRKVKPRCMDNDGASLGVTDFRELESASLQFTTKHNHLVVSMLFELHDSVPKVNRGQRDVFENNPRTTSSYDATANMTQSACLGHSTQQDLHHAPQLKRHLQRHLHTGNNNDKCT